MILNPLWITVGVLRWVLDRICGRARMNCQLCVPSVPGLRFGRGARLTMSRNWSAVGTGAIAFLMVALVIVNDSTRRAQAASEARCGRHVRRARARTQIGEAQADEAESERDGARSALEPEVRSSR